MAAVLHPLSAEDVAARMRNGTALLIDIREPDEFSREHVFGARSAPLSSIETFDFRPAPHKDVVFMCRTGNRTDVNCLQLAGRVSTPAFVLTGGLDGWKKAGFSTRLDTRKPIELMRQVQIGAGGLVLVGAGLGTLVHPAFWAISAFVGAGLLVAGATGFCGMARLLSLAPWNRA